jgi:Family of unknown function (DUF6339)
MAKAYFLRDSHLERLRQNIGPNSKKYCSDEPWLSGYFGEEAWQLQSNIEMPEDTILTLPASKTEVFDLENTQTIFTALRHLTPVQAADERLWAYLSHVTYWEYMRKRWPAEQYTNRRFGENIQDRYCFMSDRPRALIRNGIARLWWYGYSTYDETRNDPFELTAVLLKNLDVTQSILERAFSRNRTVTHAVLSVLLEREKAGKPFYARDSVRDLAKYLVRIGGVTIIDALSFGDIRDLVVRKVDQLSALTV